MVEVYRKGDFKKKNLLPLQPMRRSILPETLEAAEILTTPRRVACANPRGGIGAGGWVTDYRPARMRAEPISQAPGFCLFNRRTLNKLSGVGGLSFTHDR